MDRNMKKTIRDAQQQLKQHFDNIASIQQLFDAQEDLKAIKVQLEALNLGIE